MEGVASRRTGIGPRRWLLLAGLVLLLPGARFACSIGGSPSAVLGVRSLAVAPATVTLPPGGVAILEAFAVDELGGRAVSPGLIWRSGNPAVATVGPKRAAHTVVTAVATGETRVTATISDGLADTVLVTVVERSGR